MAWIFQRTDFFGLGKASWRADNSVFRKDSRRGPTVQSAWPKVMRLFCTPLCRQESGSWSTSFSPVGPELSVGRARFPVPWRAAPSPLSVCVSNAMRFPVGIALLGTKPSNSGHSVPGPELGLQSPAGSGLEGSWLLGWLHPYRSQRDVTFSDPLKGFSCPSCGCLGAQQLENTDPLSCGGLNSCLVFHALH